MKCEEFQRRLDRLLDSRLDPDSDWALISHAGDCHACRLDLNGQRTLVAAVESFTPPELPASFAVDVVSLAAQTQDWSPRPGNAYRRQTAGRRYSRSFAASLAVVLLVGCTFVALLSPPASDTSPKRASLLARFSSMPRAGQAKQGRLSKLPMLHNTTDDEGRNSPAVAVGADKKKVPLMSAFEPLTSISFESNEIPGVRPLMNSFDVTMSLLKRTIPRHGGSARKQPATSQVTAGGQHVV